MEPFLVVEPSSVRRDLTDAIAAAIRQGKPATLLAYGTGAIFQAVTAMGLPEPSWFVMGCTYTS